MWNYEKRLQFPVNITRPNAKIAQIIISQYGGPDGEAAASFRYLSQRYSMPYNKVAGLLTDIGTEELAHLEMIAAIVRQLTKGLSAEELESAGFAPYYVDHTAGIWPQAAGGIPFNACEFQSKGDAITDLFDDMRIGAAGTDLPAVKETFREQFEQICSFVLRTRLSSIRSQTSSFTMLLRQRLRTGRSWVSTQRQPLYST